MGRKRLKTIYRRTVLRLSDLDNAKSAVLNSLTSSSSRRVYEHAIEEFIAWYCSEPRLAFNRIVVVRYRIHLEARNLAAATINQRLAAVRRLAHEAADSGLLSPELAACIQRVKGAKQLGHRSGNWLTLEQSANLLNSARGDGLRERRDYAMLAVLLGCGLRRSELVGLAIEKIQVRQGHWVIVDLIGKGGHIRTIPIPQWVKLGVDRWTTASGVSTGRLFRAIGKNATVHGRTLRERCLVRRRSLLRENWVRQRCPARSTAYLREIVPREWGRTGTDPVSIRPRFGADHRTILGLQTELVQSS